ncbi:hypothetical protein NPIL_703491 [Nephila pilipes]|uniref:Uncharacterized protein n=1 Tax=Nephila pilipes TaxID=299642 RepID=A0A8X6MV96_NEPPI|nr:hypothetical protein NPIL_703491 [Nephila pilipes]
MERSDLENLQRWSYDMDPRIYSQCIHVFLTWGPLMRHGQSDVHFASLSSLKAGSEESCSSITLCDKMKRRRLSVLSSLQLPSHPPCLWTFCAVSATSNEVLFIRNCSSFLFSQSILEQVDSCCHIATSDRTNLSRPPWNREKLSDACKQRPKCEERFCRSFGSSRKPKPLLLGSGADVGPDGC